MTASLAAKSDFDERSQGPATGVAVDTITPVAALRRLLRQLRDLILSMSDEQYVRRPGRASPVGAHVRHALDHVAALLRSQASGEIDYDERERGTTVETQRAVALAQIQALDEELSRLRSEVVQLPLRMHARLEADGPRDAFDTTFGRELAFVCSHTIHHNALIAVAAWELGIELPQRFGYAPATIRHLDRPACAPSPSFR
ncbi:MAG: DinB family protein [Phycisphaerae bacterium]|jgi:uncharacterized damage-inducible protein DinB